MNIFAFHLNCISISHLQKFAFQSKATGPLQVKCKQLVKVHSTLKNNNVDQFFFYTFLLCFENVYKRQYIYISLCYVGGLQLSVLWYILVQLRFTVLFLCSWLLVTHRVAFSCTTCVINSLRFTVTDLISTNILAY